MATVPVAVSPDPASGNTTKSPITIIQNNVKFLRIMFFIITVIFTIVGIVMVVLGIAVYLEYHDMSFFLENVRSGRILTPSVMTTIAGMVLLAVTFFGFVGNMKLSTCMVNFYAVFLTVIIIIKLVIVSLAFTIEAHTLMRYVYLPIDKFGSDPEIEYEINTLQQSFGCCGGDSFMDYLGMEYAEHQNTTYIMKEHENNLVVMELPETCCVTREYNRCVRMHRMGCKQAIITVISQNASAIGVLGVAVMIIMVLGIFFALLLALNIRRLKSAKALIAWKIKEQAILGQNDVVKAEIEHARYIANTQSVNFV